MERQTRQRAAIRRAFVEARRPMSPHEVLDAASPFAPGLGIATVYRALKELVEEGLLVPVALPGEADRYEAAGQGHHHHFRCNSCERVYEVDGCPGDLSRLAPVGFVVQGHEVLLYGQCARCAAG